MTYTVWPLRFSANPPAMIDFYAALGLNHTVSHASGSYAVFAGRGGRLGVHDTRTAASTTAGHTALNLMTADVDAAAGELRAAGLQVLVWDETYGKQGAITSPAGLIIGINEIAQEDLYGGYQQLDQLGDQTVAASMDVVAICTVEDVEREADFFASFGFTALEPGDGYLPLTAGPDAGVVGLRAGVRAPARGHDQVGPPYLVDLGAETSEPLDALADRLRAGGHVAETVEDDSGVWVRVTDPDGESLEVRPTR